MAIKFILGTSGTGKSTTCVRQIIHQLNQTSEKQNLILLVPEQATYQMERAILTSQNLQGYHRLKVLSFQRLCFLLNKDKNVPDQLTKIGRRMIIHRILRQNAEKLQVYRLSADTPGMAEKLENTILQLHQAALEPDQLKNMVQNSKKQKPESVSTIKFADISLIFEKYHQFIKGRFTDPDTQITSNAHLTQNAHLLKNFNIWIDGFASFTTAQMYMLTELLKKAKLATIALCLDPENIQIHNFLNTPVDDTNIFQTTRKTLRSILSIARKNSIKLDQPIILDKNHRFKKSPDLDHLEKNIFKGKSIAVKSKGNIVVNLFAEPRQEVNLTARQIAALVRENNFRYRDIAVITSQLDDYTEYIEAAFADYDIPFFLDMRKPISSHPMIELILAALEFVINPATMENLFAMLRTGYFKIEKNQIDILENYCLAFGVKPATILTDKKLKFDNPDKPEFDEKKINLIRNTITQPLRKLKSAVIDTDKKEQKIIDTAVFTAAVFDFLKNCSAIEILNTKIENSPLEQKHQHQQFYDGLIDIFDQLNEIFAGLKLTPVEITAILKRAMHSMTLAFIPPTIDQVLVGSIDRSRHPNLKAVFLLDCSAKNFPSPLTFDNILTDDEHQLAMENDIVLSNSTTQQLTDRQYLAYIAFTRPSEKLYISCPLTDAAGKAKMPSQFLNSLKQLFKDIPSYNIQLDPQSLFSKNQLEEMLCAALGPEPHLNPQTTQILQAVTEKLTQNPLLKDSAQLALRAGKFENRAELSSQNVKTVKDRHKCFSQSRLAALANCPYQYFAKYVLKLQERKIFSLKPMDLGSLYHTAMERLFIAMQKNNIDYKMQHKQQILALLETEYKNLINDDRFYKTFASQSLHNQWIINSQLKTLQDFVHDVINIASAGHFKQFRTEARFGPGRNINLKIKTDQNEFIELRGIIDRIDIAKKQNENIALVFDYKTSENSFDWKKFYHGLQLQLPIYILAVRNAKLDDIKIDDVAGAFYLGISQSVPKENERSNGKKAKGIFNGQYVDLLDKITSKSWSPYYNFAYKQDQPYGNFKKSGVLKPQQFQTLLDFTVDHIKRMIHIIHQGKIEIRPYRLDNETPCKYCPYRPVCRFDWQINKYNILDNRVDKTYFIEAECKDES